jgi:hypothetical protein
MPESDDRGRGRGSAGAGAEEDGEEREEVGDGDAVDEGVFGYSKQYGCGDLAGEFLSQYLQYSGYT